jgi:hypothetical protein
VFSSPWLAEPCSAVLHSSCSFSCELFTAALNERSTPKLRPIPLHRWCDFFIHGMMRLQKASIRYMHGTQQRCRRNSVAGGTALQEVEKRFACSLFFFCFLLYVKLCEPVRTSSTPLNNVYSVRCGSRRVSQLCYEVSSLSSCLFSRELFTRALNETHDIRRFGRSRRLRPLSIFLYMRLHTLCSV